MTVLDDKTSYDNCGKIYKILRLFDVLPNFLFTTSETIRDYYATRTAERLLNLRFLGN